MREPPILFNGAMVRAIEAAFLSHILLSSGQTVIEHVQQQKLLPQETPNG